MAYVKYILVGIVLLGNAITDIKRKEIVLKSLIAASIVFIMLLYWEHSVTFVSRVAGMSIGFLLIFISKITREQIGLGDGIVFLFTGFTLGFWDNLLLIMYSLTAAFVYIVILYMRQGVIKEKRIAFVPFICMGYVGVLCL